MSAGICLTAGAIHAFIAASHFTHAWTHSIEKVRWEEDYRISGRVLRIEEARIRGSGAGMEPPPGAVLREGAWHYRPAIGPLRELRLARSGYTSDYELCVPGSKCLALAHWIPVEAGTTLVTPCSR